MTDSKCYKDKNWLLEQYWGFDLSMSKIAEMANCSWRTIQYWFEKYEIPLRSLQESIKKSYQDGRIPHNKIEIDKNWLLDQYCKNNLTCKEIGEIIGCSANAVFNRLKEFNIPRRKPALRYNPDSKYNTIFYDYKHHAEKRNIPFNLSFNDFKKLILQPCCYCKSPPNKLNGVDRKDNSKGYTKDNSVACCKYCNFAKYTLSEKEFAEKIISRYNWAKNYLKGGYNVQNQT